MKRMIVPVMLLSLLVAGITSCKKDKDIKSNVKVFKVELFKQNLDSQLNGIAIGYAFVINKNGQFADSASGGIARSSNPAGGGGSTPMSIHSTINIASVTKAFTAMCMLQLLDQNNLTIDDAIGPWLPTYWPQNNAISTLTFKELMTHKSGIWESNTGWDSLKATVAQPLDNPAKAYKYANANFALFRAMIPKLYDKTTFNSQQGQMVQGNDGTAFETWMANRYIAIMQEKVFTPAGVNNATCNLDPNNTNCQAFNEQPPNNLVARENGDWTETCGGGGYNLTTWQMAAVMAFLAHSEAILSGTQKARMDDNMLGWDGVDSPNSSQGKVYGKDGALYWDNNGDKSVNAGDSGLQTLVQKYPNGVELTLTINSIGNGWRNPASMALSAYEAAWVVE